MRNQPVLWSEGMFLSPHHFQAMERSWTEALQTDRHFDHAYNYGIHSIDIVEESLKKGHFEIRLCRGRTIDGTVLSIGSRLAGSQGGIRVNVADALESRREVKVYLGVPKPKSGRPLIGESSSQGEFTYLRKTVNAQDEVDPASEREIELRELNVRVLLSTDEPELPGYDVLPIAQVRRPREGESEPTIDTRYIPPALTIDAWPELGIKIVRPICDLIGQKIQQMGDPFHERGMSFVGFEPHDASRFYVLTMLSGAYAALRHLTFASNVHPATVYHELCRIAGMLTVFHEDGRADDFPLYDHEDLATIFRWIKVRIEQSLKGIPLMDFHRRFFTANITEEHRRRMHVLIDPAWREPGWSWYIGVNRGDLSDSKCDSLLTREMHWKIGGPDNVDILFERMMEDVGLKQVKEIPAILRSGTSWLYYEVDQSSVAFANVADTDEMAMRFNPELIREMVNGATKIEVKASGDVVSLEFAVFAVRSAE